VRGGGRGALERKIDYEELSPPGDRKASSEIDPGEIGTVRAEKGLSQASPRAHLLSQKHPGRIENDGSKRCDRKGFRTLPRGGKRVCSPQQRQLDEKSASAKPRSTERNKKKEPRLEGGAAKQKRPLPEPRTCIANSLSRGWGVHVFRKVQLLVRWREKGSRRGRSFAGWRSRTTQTESNEPRGSTEWDRLIREQQVAGKGKFEAVPKK